MPEPGAAAGVAEPSEPVRALGPEQRREAGPARLRPGLSAVRARAPEPGESSELAQERKLGRKELAEVPQANWGLAPAAV